MSLKPSQIRGWMNWLNSRLLTPGWSSCWKRGPNCLLVVAEITRTAVDDRNGSPHPQRCLWLSPWQANMVRHQWSIEPPSNWWTWISPKSTRFSLGQAAGYVTESRQSHDVGIGPRNNDCTAVICWAIPWEQSLGCCRRQQAWFGYVPK